MTAPRISTRAKHRLRSGNESQLVTAILRALKLKGVFCWRNNSGLTVLPEQAKSRRRVIKGGEAGSPDIFVVLPTGSYWVKSEEHIADIGGGLVTSSKLLPIGTLCGLEVKTATGKQSASQKIWQARAEQHGVRYAVVRGVGEALDVVKKWSRA
jgi:hypothetical protein